MTSINLSHRHRINLSVEIDFNSDTHVVKAAKRELELAAAEAIEMARQRIKEKTSAEVESYAMKASLIAV